MNESMNERMNGRKDGCMEESTDGSLEDDDRVYQLKVQVRSPGHTSAVCLGQ